VAEETKERGKSCEKKTVLSVSSPRQKRWGGPMRHTGDDSSVSEKRACGRKGEMVSRTKEGRNENEPMAFASTDELLLQLTRGSIPVPRPISRIGVVSLDFCRIREEEKNAKAKRTVNAPVQSGPLRLYPSPSPSSPS
jgi:hypothetical protein